MGLERWNSGRSPESMDFMHTCTARDHRLICIMILEDSIIPDLTADDIPTVEKRTQVFPSN